MTHRDAIDFALWTMSKNEYGNITKQEALICAEGYCLCFPCSDRPEFSVDIDFSERDDVIVYFTLYAPTYYDDEIDYEAYDSYSTTDFSEAQDIFKLVYNESLIDRRCNRWNQ